MLNRISGDMQAIPHGFERYKQFLNWRLVPDADHPGKMKKLPCDIHGQVVSAHDPANWMSADEAAKSAHGLAFVFAPSDPFWFIDLDGHFIDGKPSQFAQWCIDYFTGCAVEVSASGNGLHLFGAGAHSLPINHGCRNTVAGIELYSTGRFVALTGMERRGSAWIDYSDRLLHFLGVASLKPREIASEAQGSPETGEEVDPRYTGPEDDEALLDLMLASTGSLANMFGSKAHVRDLWEANREVLARCYPASGRSDGLPYDASEADAALMWHLAFWCGRDRERMARLFERSALYRPGKYTGRGAYRLGLVIKQGLRNARVYDKPRAGVTAPAAPETIGLQPVDRDARSLMLVEEQIEHFKDCVYVQSAHAVLVPDGRLLRPHVFNAVYGGRTFQMQHDRGRPTTEAFKAFTENRMVRFPSAVDTCFRPDRAPNELVNGRINVWRLPEVEEAEGCVERFLAHMRKLFPIENDFRIIITYMQSLARNYGVKFQWAPVIQGAEGNGKSLIIRVLYRAISHIYSHLPKASQITEKYNSWIEGKLFIGVEEIKVTDRIEVLEDLKDAITNDWVEVRGMQRDKKMVDNYSNWVLCTNHRDAVPVNKDGRRYAIFYTAQQSKADIDRDGMSEEYFIGLYDWLRKEGGYAAVAHWLRHSEILAPEYDPAGRCQRAPMTSSTEEAIKISMGRVEQEIMEAVESGLPGFRDDWISTAAAVRLLEKNGVRTISKRKLGEIIKSLGYDYIDRASRKIAEEEDQQPRLYRRNGKKGSVIDYCMSQGYNRSLEGFRHPTILIR